MADSSASLPAAALESLLANPGKPLSTREETVAAVEALIGTKDRAPDDRPPFSNVHGQGPFLLSDIPESARKQGVVVGIDEAGRGSVVGPMIYGAAYWHVNVADQVPKDFNDSKQLTEEKRSNLFSRILETPVMGFCARVLHASEISRSMLRPEPYNLNQMSHDAAMDMLRHLLAAGVAIDTAYIDTVGNAGSYQRRLEQEFPNITFVVESKADAKYAPCSAGSVGKLTWSGLGRLRLSLSLLNTVAKVVRDRMIESWKFSEQQLDAETNFGSGYPSDPVCKKWMEKHLQCKIFGFPDAVRFSWGPAKKALEKDAIAVMFEADEEDDDDAEGRAVKKRQQLQMSIFLGQQASAKKRKRYPFFERRNLGVVKSL